MGAGEICHLAAELADEHGDAALVYARRDRAAFWHALSIFIDDIMNCRLDPELPIVFH